MYSDSSCGQGAVCPCDTNPDQSSDFERLAKLAAYKLGTRAIIVAAVRDPDSVSTVVHGVDLSSDRENLEMTARMIAAQAIEQARPIPICELHAHPLFSDDRMTVACGVASCIALPLPNANGRNNAALCVFDTEPRVWTDEQIRDLSRLVRRQERADNKRKRAAGCNDADQLRLLTAAVAATNDVILVCDAEPIDEPGPRVVYVNPAFTRMTGYAASEILGKTPRILQGVNSDRATRDLIRSRLKKWKPVRVELLNYRKDGTPFWVELDIRPVADEDGWYTHWVAVQRDVTERKLREEEMRRNEAETRKLAMVAKTTENAVIIADVNGHIEWVNDAFMRLTGYALDDVKGRSSGSFLQGPDTDADTAMAMLERIRQGEGFQAEILNYTKDRQPYWVAIDCRPVHDESGALTGFIAVQADITARRHHEDANKQFTADLTKAYEATIEGWARALDLRDHETEGHSRRVTEMTVRLARAMDVPEADIVHIRRGALLHDIGKMGVPDAILRKPGPLTEGEWVVMREHPVLAKEMLKSIEFLQPALDIPYGHHERWDGSGYPLGLKGDATPLAARIFAVIDLWDALSNDRPYRRAWPDSAVFEYIQSLAGDKLDPQVVAAFLAMLAQDKGTQSDPQSPAEHGTRNTTETPSWKPAPKPENELERLEALQQYEVLDSEPENAFDDLVHLAARICETPMALISLIDSDRQWFKARLGVGVEQTHRDLSFCAHTILDPEPTIIADATKDPRFAGNPCVLESPNVRFYAGVPLVGSRGHNIGTLCVIDRVPRNLSAEKIDSLKALSRQAVAQLELRRINNGLELERHTLEADIARLGTLAATDPLTGLANRRQFDDALAQFTSQSGLRNEPLSLILADVDRFKAYNDDFGHPAGDEALKTVAELLRGSCRRQDMPARYGGEEFAVLLPGASIQAATAAARRIQAVVGAREWPLRQLCLSMGVATALPGECARDLIAKADAALYRAKADGRNCIVIADSHSPEQIDTRSIQNDQWCEMQLAANASDGIAG